MDPFVIQYDFVFEDGYEWRYRLEMQPDTLALKAHPDCELPDWAVLGFHQCPHCPLSTAQHQYCPLAANLVDLLDGVGRLPSFGNARVEVTTPDRSVSADISCQRAVGSLLGLVSATSDCPHTACLRPMARFHLPFASEDETVYRASSMYLLAQYFRYGEGHDPDLSLAGLTSIYVNLHILNKAMGERLRAACEQDAAVNALVLLDLLAKAMPYNIDDNMESIRHLFHAYLDE